MTLIKSMKADQLHVEVFDTRQAMGEAAATKAAAYLRERLKSKETISVLFAAAPSQNEFLAALCRDETIDWQRITAFHMDEYIGLNETHPAGFRSFLKRSIFDRKPFRAIYLLNGNAPSISAEIARYSHLLQANPLDAVFMGIGENGHIAFNDPPVADFNDPCIVKRVCLEARCRWQQVHDGCFDTIDQVPTHALTVTIPGIMGAGRLFCMVPAASKAEAVAAAVMGPVHEACPASILRRHPAAFLYCDRDSGARLL